MEKLNVRKPRHEEHLITEIFAAICFGATTIGWHKETICHGQAWGQACEYNLARFSKKQNMTHELSRQNWLGQSEHARVLSYAGVDERRNFMNALVDENGPWVRRIEEEVGSVGIKYVDLGVQAGGLWTCDV